jgi:hypothetical protein
MRAKKKSATKAGATKSSAKAKVKDLKPKKNPRGGIGTDGGIWRGVGHG